MFSTRKGITILLHISILLFIVCFIPLITEMEKKRVIDNEIIQKQIERTIIASNIKNPAHVEVFISVCDRFQFDWMLALSISKIESQHYQYACSDFPARGYFQITDDTFQFICEKFPGLRFFNKWSVYDGANNIFVGIYYANYLITKYGREQGLEIYNVGEGNYFWKGRRSQKYVQDILSEYRILLKKKIQLEEEYR